MISDLPANAAVCLCSTVRARVPGPMQSPLGFGPGSVLLPHRCCDIGAGRPLTASLARVPRICIQPFRIRLHRHALFKEQKASVLCRHLPDKLFGFVKNASNTFNHRRRLKRLLDGQGTPDLGGVIEVATDFTNQSLRRENQATSRRQPRPKRQSSGWSHEPSRDQ